MTIERIAINGFSIPFKGSNWRLRVVKLGDEILVALYWGDERSQPTYAKRIPADEFFEVFDKMRDA